MPKLFADGEYHPLGIDGPLNDHVFAFARRGDGCTVIIAVGRHLATLTPPAATLPYAEIWGDTALRIPEPEPARGRDVLTGRIVESDNGSVAIGKLFSVLPSAVLVMDVP